jgi:hypothetical protein
MKTLGITSHMIASRAYSQHLLSPQFMMNIKILDSNPSEDSIEAIDGTQIPVIVVERQDQIYKQER